MESIRKIERKDCQEFAHLVTTVWNETYQGIVDTNFLNSLKENEQSRADSFKEKFNPRDNHLFVLEIDSKIVGFINVGKAINIELNNCGEVFALYILSKYQKKGYSNKLLKAGSKELKQMGFDKMIIGCLENNKANDFYRHIGGKYIKKRLFKKLNLNENVYLFENL